MHRAFRAYNFRLCKKGAEGLHHGRSIPSSYFLYGELFPMAEAENPTLIKDKSRNPEEKAEVFELKNRICEAMKKLSQREQDLIEAKYFYDKKLKDISVEFNISQSRISRIIQNGLDKIKKDLLKQEQIDEENLS